MKQSKYERAFQKLSKKSVFTSVDGLSAGIPSRMFSYFCSKGQIERVSRGIYKIKEIEFDQDFEWEDLALTAMSIPNGTICPISALCYYELTDEIMREFWIAVPHSTTSPKRENAHIVRMRNTTLGQITIKIGNDDVKIFDHERTIVDAFRYLDKEIALKALQTYLKATKENKPDLKKLRKYAKTLRVDLTPYIMAFTM
ncbi:type IV toxin-antitoxin system AbiEi family antitoxin domain-containing protein [Candidatus Protochlamydia amoebophila]|nr:type IV toxin-antitoxin system AbiEi family antitoxin domain-containing protein [Candidatus Protochlamydia amoebophila]